MRDASRALGYFGQQDRFDASIDHDGCSDTGDLARYLGEAGIRVLGRAADIIWSQGRVVPSIEIEAAIQLVNCQRHLRSQRHRDGRRRTLRGHRA